MTPEWTDERCLGIMSLVESLVDFDISASVQLGQAAAGRATLRAAAHAGSAAAASSLVPSTSGKAVPQSSSTEGADQGNKGLLFRPIGAATQLVEATKKQFATSRQVDGSCSEEVTDLRIGAVGGLNLAVWNGNMTAVDDFLRQVGRPVTSRPSSTKRGRRSESQNPRRGSWSRTGKVVSWRNPGEQQSRELSHQKRNDKAAAYPSLRKRASEMTSEPILMTSSRNNTARFGAEGEAAATAKSQLLAEAETGVDEQQAKGSANRRSASSSSAANGNISTSTVRRASNSSSRYLQSDMSKGAVRHLPGRGLAEYPGSTLTDRSASPVTRTSEAKNERSSSRSRGSGLSPQPRKSIPHGDRLSSSPKTAGGTRASSASPSPLNKGISARTTTLDGTSTVPSSPPRSSAKTNSTTVFTPKGSGRSGSRKEAASSLTEEVDADDMRRKKAGTRGKQRESGRLSRNSRSPRRASEQVATPTKRDASDCASLPPSGVVKQNSKRETALEAVEGSGSWSTSATSD
ncbi:unnamed protein product [Amoebophrya sp. A25]|nr:unnamed protein product [Amoebophrya sp. A25]|eukprot:GSA25T00026939001.1